MTRKEGLLGYVASIIHLFFACSTSLVVFVLLFTETNTSGDFSGSTAVVLAITIPATISMCFVVVILAMKWSRNIVFQTLSMFYVAIGVVSYYTTLSPIAAYLHPDSFAGPGTADRMMMAGIHELEYYLMVVSWMVCLAVVARDGSLPTYGKVFAYLCGLNTIVLLTATLICGHNAVYDVSTLLTFIIYPIFVTAVIVMMRRLYHRAKAEPA